MLGKDQNADLAQIALVGAAYDALPEVPPDETLEVLAAELRQVVVGSPTEAEDALALLSSAASSGDRWRKAIVEDHTCRSLLDALWKNYVLFAVLAGGGPNRRILKYSYGEGFSFTTDDVRWRHRIHPTRIAGRVSRPDRREFIVECPGAWRAQSFHAEISIPEELRIELAVLHDVRGEEQLGEADENVDRASLYASGIAEHQFPGVFAVVAPERAGRVLRRLSAPLARRQLRSRRANPWSRRIHSYCRCRSVLGPRRGPGRTPLGQPHLCRFPVVVDPGHVRRAGCLCNACDGNPGCPASGTVASRGRRCDRGSGASRLDRYPRTRLQSQSNVVGWM